MEIDINESYFEEHRAPGLFEDDKKQFLILEKKVSLEKRKKIFLESSYWNKKATDVTELKFPEPDSMATSESKFSDWAGKRNQYEEDLCFEYYEKLGKKYNLKLSDIKIIANEGSINNWPQKDPKKDQLD